MTTPSSSYQQPTDTIILPDDETDSLPSSTVATSSSSDDEESDAEREWRESLQQIELLLSMVLIPYLGKYFGRKCAYWAWSRFMTWRYPVTIEITNPRLFKATGVIEAALPL